MGFSHVRFGSTMCVNQERVQPTLQYCRGESNPSGPVRFSKISSGVVNRQGSVMSLSLFLLVR